jgi:RNA polymerase sigma-70 factor (sigma-E family)
VEFEVYVHQRRQALARFATILSSDPGLADEIVSDVLGTAFERWATIRNADSPHAYVRKMVLNEYLGWRRRSARMAVRAEIGDLLKPVVDHADEHAEHEQLARELKRLPAKQRAAIVLRYYEDLPFAEIAELLGSGENAVRSNISRGLRQLRIQITEPEVTDQPDAPTTLEVRR